MKRNCTNRIYQLIYCGVCLGLLACNPDIDSEINAGRLNFQQYVAIGDGYTAGYSNNALYESGQLLSPPNLLVRQLAMVRSSRFSQPLLNERGTGYQLLEEVIPSACEDVSASYTIEKLSPDASLNQNIHDQGPYHNLGIPGLSLSAINTNTLQEDNPFFSRIIEPSSNTTYISYVTKLAGDLFTIWLGTDDILAYAREGAANNELLPISASQFETQMTLLLDSLISPNRSITILVNNIPDITHFPFFTTISHLFVDETTCLSSPIYIEAQDQSGEYSVRPARPEDHILLSIPDIIGYTGGDTLNYGLNPESPITNEWILDELETQKVQTFIDAYNQRIESLVNLYREKARLNQYFLVVDIHQYLLNATTSGLTVDGVDLSGEFLTGGIFSLDGLYLSPRGNAIITNILIERINGSFSAKIPEVNITDFEGVIFP